MPLSLEPIPVLDLKGGIVVRAAGGERSRYPPLASPLAGGRSDPLSVAAALLALAPFRRVYLADLDAIAGCGHHDDVVRALASAHPGVEWWLDRGARNPGACADLPAVPVIGSENLDASCARPSGEAWILSLDFRAGRRLGTAAWLDDAGQWPRRVILMSLDHVGAGRGPDLARLARLRAQAPDRRWYAAGGVRHAADLERLAEAGASGVLLASALHDGHLAPAALRPYLAGTA
jgi:HisA/HisF family protein